MRTWDAKLSQVVFGGDRVFLANLDRLDSADDGMQPQLSLLRTENGTSRLNSNERSQPGELSLTPCTSPLYHVTAIQVQWYYTTVTIIRNDWRDISSSACITHVLSSMMHVFSIFPVI